MSTAANYLFHLASGLHISLTRLKLNVLNAALGDECSGSVDWQFTVHRV